MSQLDIGADVVSVLHRVGATAHRMLRMTDKATVVGATWRGERVVVKVLTTVDEYWRRLWTREARVYADFAACGPPFAAPAVLYDEDDVRIVTYVDGEVLHTDRFPAHPLDVDLVTAAVAAVSSVATWQTTCIPTVDYGHLLDRTGPGFDRGAASAALDRVDAARVSQHGDPLASNLLVAADGCCVLVDFEHSGLFLPVLWGWISRWRRATFVWAAQQLAFATLSSTTGVVQAARPGRP